jgi:hypothetical protein
MVISSPSFLASHAFMGVDGPGPAISSARSARSARRGPRNRKVRTHASRFLGFTSRGTGTLFGVIGGYQAGGDYDWASYSVAFGVSALSLYRQAEATAALQ